MKKRILSIMTVFAMIFTLLPTTAFAANNITKLNVGNTTVVEGGDVHENTTGDGWSYDSENNILTLTDADITGVASTYFGAGIYVEGDITIMLIGSSSITGVQPSLDANSGGIIVRKGNLTVIGDGSLTVNAADGKDSNNSYAIQVDYDMNQQGGSITCNGGNGIFSYGMYLNGKLIVHQGSITACGGTATETSYGIYINAIDASVSVNDATMTATSGIGSNGSYGIYIQALSTTPSVTVSNGSSLTAHGKSATNTAFGIYLGTHSSSSTGTMTVEDNSTLLTNSVILNASFNERPLAPIGEGSWLIYGQKNQSSTMNGSFTLTEDVEISGDVAIPTNGNINLNEKTLTNNGTLTISNKLNLTGDGTLTGNGEFNITNLEPVITVDDSLTYDGTNQINKIKLTPSEESEIEILGKIFTVSDTPSTDGWSIEKQELISAGKYTVTAKKDNMSISDEITIQKATTNANTGYITIVNNAEKTYTYDLSQLLPTLDNGKTLGDIDYELDVVSLGNYYTDDAYINENTLSLPINAVINDKEEQIGTITVKIKSTNYEDMTATINVSATNKQAQKLIISGQPTSVVYGDTFKLTATSEGSGAVTWSATGCATIDNDGNVKINGIGDFSITASKAEDDTYIATSQSLNMTSNKKPLTITADNQSINVGANMPDFTYKTTELATGDKFENPTITTTAKDTNNSGTYDINISGGTLTNSDYYDVNYVAGKLTISTNSSGGSSSGGSSSGGSSSGGSSSSDDKTETTTNPNGSTTTTVTKPDGSKTETTKNPDGSQEVVQTDKDGTVTTTTIDTNGNKTEVIENNDGSSVTTVTNKDGSGLKTTVDTNGKVEIEATITENNSTLPIASVNTTSNNTITVNMPSTSKVEIPVKNVDINTVAVLVKADGTEEIIKTSITTENGISVTLNDGDTIKIIDNSKEFTDVNSDFWGENAVNFVTSREIFNGTGENTFSPNTAMTRAMIVTVLARLNGVDTSTGDIWYEVGQKWAIENGISDGLNMNENLTREQLAVMLYRYSGNPTVSEDLTNFTDNANISSWATDAMNWAVNTGLISGMGDGTLNPQGEATRAQVATILMRFISNY